VSRSSHLFPKSFRALVNLTWLLLSLLLSDLIVAYFVSSEYVTNLALPSEIPSTGTAFSRDIAIKSQSLFTPANLAVSYYIKPNYQGRSSHVCNGGFVVPESSRGLGIGGIAGRFSSFSSNPFLSHFLGLLTKFSFMSLKVNLFSTTLLVVDSNLASLTSSTTPIKLQSGFGRNWASKLLAEFQRLVCLGLKMERMKFMWMPMLFMGTLRRLE